MAADGGARRGVLAVLTALLVVAAVTIAALDLTGRLPGGLVADPASSPTAAPTLDPPRSPAPEVLAAEPTAAGPAPVLPEAALDAVLASPALGGAAGAAVLDVITGQMLLDRDAGTARIPASVAKLATAAAVLTAYDPGHRVRTRVLAGADGSGGTSVVLVGAGDATLTTRRSRPGDLPRRASLADLADQVVAALPTGRVGGLLTVRVDDSLFTGPAVSPDWPASYVSSGAVSPVSALSVDGGRVRPRSVAREADPALAAGRELARLLRRRGVEVSPDVTRGTAPAGVTVLAEVASPTVAEMVELALQTSDNDVAEALLRLAAVGQGQPATLRRRDVGSARRVELARRTHRGRRCCLTAAVWPAAPACRPRRWCGCCCSPPTGRTRSSHRCSTACRWPDSAAPSRPATSPARRLRPPACCGPRPAPSPG